MIKNKKLQTDCFKLTKTLLREYRHIDSHIKSLEYTKDSIAKGDTTAMRAITYDSDKISPTFKINNCEADGVIRKVKVLQELDIKIYNQKALKNKLNRAINNLSTIHRDIIELRYQNGLQWKEIADTMAYEERALREKKNQAIRSIAIELFGIKVFKEENPTLFDMIQI